MKQEELKFTLRGTLMHAPSAGVVEILENALVAVDNHGQIATVTTPGNPGYAELEQAAAQAGKLERLSPQEYLLPGLVDTHIHAPQWPQLGKALDRPLDEWLQQYTFPLEAKYADLEFAEQVYHNLVHTLLANGTTTALYYATIHLEASKRLAEICLEQGQRALVGKIAMDNPEQCPDYYRDASAGQGLEDTERFMEQVLDLPGNTNKLVRPVITPRFIPSCTDEMLQGLGELAQRSGCHVQTHCSEGDWEHGYVLERHGRTDTHSLDGFGLLTPRTVLAHCNFINAEDMGVIKQAQTGIAHCPLSNLYLANAVFPAREALDAGLQVGLGTDIAGGANPGILHNCQMAVAAARAREDGVNPNLQAAERGTAGARIDFREAFWMATAGGGEALDLKVGKFVEDYAFDAIVIDTGVADSNLIIWEELDRGDDILQKIIYNADRGNIGRVWVQGELLRG